jgi:hypothetical protein
MTREQDLVLIYFEEAPMSYARVESIEPDVKPDWYHVTLLLLQVPLQTVTWILRSAYIDGDTFTMDGNAMRLERVDAPRSAADPVPDDESVPDAEPGVGDASAKVIPLSVRRRDT